MPARYNGFTLIEAIISLALLGVLIGVALPAWTGLRARTFAATARAELHGTLTTAISHAGRTGTEVVLCPVEGRGCKNTWDWSGGWIAFADVDGNRRRAPGEAMVWMAPPLEEDIRLVTSTGRRRLVMQPNGGNAGSNVTFTLCSTQGAIEPEVMVLSNTGQLRDAPATKARARACAVR